MLPVSHVKKYSNWTTDLISLGFICLIFYLLWLGSYPLFTPDEGRYSEVAREMVATGDYITPRVNGVAFLDKPVLYYWLQALAIGLFGIKEWAIRLFPALAGIFGCLITYVCGRYLFNRRTGFMSAIILAASPLYFCGAHYANLDLEVAVWISASLLLFITGVQTSHRHLLLAAYVCAAFAFLTKGLIGLAFPILIIGSWIALTKRWYLLTKIHLIKGMVIFLAIVLPWYILVQKANPEFLHYFFVTQQVTRFLSAEKFNNAMPVWFYLPIVFVGFFPWCGFIIQAFNHALRGLKQSAQDYQTELFLILWISIVFLFFSIPHSKMITYILPIFPAMALLVGNYFSTMWDRAQNASIFRGMIFVVIMSLLISAALLILPHYEWEFVTAAFNPYLKKLAIIFILSAVFTLLLIKQRKIFPLFLTLTTTTVLFLLTLASGAVYLNNNTAKPLVAELKTFIQPEDEVVSYHQFHQDVPMYLERRITIAADWDSPEIAQHDN